MKNPLNALVAVLPYNLKVKTEAVKKEQKRVQNSLDELERPLDGLVSSNLKEA